MTFARLNGLVMHHCVDGPADAPVIAFANSLGTDLRVWDALLPMLPAGFRHVRYDKRGHGLSSAGAGPLRIEDLAGDLAALLDHQRVSGAIVVGLSIGGMIAQALAASRPDLVRGVVLMDTAHKIGTAEMWGARIDAVRQGGIESIADSVMERWFAKPFRERRKEELEGWRNMLVRTPAEAYMACCGAIRDADLTASTKALAIPALCMAGDQDGSTPPDLVRQTAALIEGAGFEVITEAAHIPCVEQPVAVGRLITSFIEEKLS